MPSNRKRTINQKSNSRSKLYLCSHLYQKQPIALQMNPRRTRKRSTSTIHYTCIKQKAQKIVKRKGEKKNSASIQKNTEKMLLLITLSSSEARSWLKETKATKNKRANRRETRFASPIYLSLENSLKTLSLMRGWLIWRSGSDLIQEPSY